MATLWAHILDRSHTTVMKSVIFHSPFALKYPKTTDYRDVKPYNLAMINRRFEAICCLHLQKKWIRQRHIHIVMETSNLVKCFNFNLCSYYHTNFFAASTICSKCDNAGRNFSWMSHKKNAVCFSGNWPYFIRERDIFLNCEMILWNSRVSTVRTPASLCPPAKTFLYDTNDIHLLQHTHLNIAHGFTAKFTHIVHQLFSVLVCTTYYRSKRYSVHPRISILSGSVYKWQQYVGCRCASVTKNEVHLPSLALF